jgi:hypothetical protein
MTLKDAIVFLSPYLALFLFIFIIICCFIIRYPRGQHIENIDIEEQHRLDEQIEALPQQDNGELEEAFRVANINRLELVNSMVNYAKYLKEKMEREKMEREKNEEGIVIFINPGDTEPVLGQLMTDY